MDQARSCPYESLALLNTPNSRKEITDIGSLPYTIVRPILLKIDSAAQLRAIEEASPHIEVDDAECWIRLIERKFPVLHNQNQFEPRNPASWHKVYARYARMDAEQKAEAEAKLKNAFAGIQRQKQANTSAVQSFAQSRLPKPPKDMRGDAKKSTSGRRGGSNDTGELRFTGGSRTKTNTAASVMRRVKREAAEIRARNKLMTPNGALIVRQGQIKQAPKGMVHEQQIKKNPEVKAQPVATYSREDEFRTQVMEEREARLRKLKAQGKTSSIIDDSDLEDEDADDVFGGYTGGRLNVDDLEDQFEDDEPARPSPARSSSTSAQTHRPAALPGKKKGLLSNAFKPSATTVQRSGPSSSTPARSTPGLSPTTHGSPPKPKAASTARPLAASASPPLAPTSPPKPSASTNGPSGSPELKPRMPVKRKPVDVFMKPKSKVQRR
ncbi:hypothetical protein JX266_002502 [Neoarthrinium moseri]|nr:hypothetical protein JX266_002502 [Neoarthrinium moseri]